MYNRKRLPTPATVAPRARNPLLLDDRGGGGPVREAHQSAALGGLRVQAPAWGAPRRGGDRASKEEARRAMDAPSGEAIMPVSRRGAAPS